MEKRILLLLSFLVAFYVFCIPVKKDRFKKYSKEKTILNLTHKQKKKLVSFAESYLGVKYKYAGLSKNGIDCSGLVYLSFKNVDAKIPKLSDAMAYYGKAIWKVEDLKFGDMVFFEKTYNSKNTITHVGIYIKNGKFIHASSSLGVAYSNLETNTYWKGKFAFGKRL